jgi:hypothetical protein
MWATLGFKIPRQKKQSLTMAKTSDNPSEADGPYRAQEIPGAVKNTWLLSLW